VIAITFWSFLGLRLRRANEVGGDRRTVTQYICDDHHSDPPGSVFLLSLHRLSSPTVRANPDRQRHLLHARDGGRRVPAAPSRGTLKTRKETMSAIWRSLVLKPKSATLSGQITTTSMPNIISDRCAQTQKGRKRSCCNGPSRSGPCG